MNAFHIRILSGLTVARVRPTAWKLMYPRQLWVVRRVPLHRLTDSDDFRAVQDQHGKRDEMSTGLLPFGGIDAYTETNAVVVDL
jgi:hypothetical protein